MNDEVNEMKRIDKSLKHDDSLPQCPLCEKLIRHFEDLGLTTSDAQAAAEAEHLMDAAWTRVVKRTVG